LGTWGICPGPTILRVAGAEVAGGAPLTEAASSDG